MRVVATKLLFWAQGMTIHPNLILIRPERAGDAALVAHERRHCEQMREIGTFRFWCRYLVRRHRLRFELEAYRVQLAMVPWQLDGIAARLAGSYWLGITTAQAKALLLEPAR